MASFLFENIIFLDIRFSFATYFRSGPTEDFVLHSTSNPKELANERLALKPSWVMLRVSFKAWAIKHILETRSVCQRATGTKEHHDRSGRRDEAYYVTFKVLENWDIALG